MTTPEFGSRIAARYDELRPLDAGLEGLLGQLDDAGDLRGRRILDVGCGTGAIAHAPPVGLIRAEREITSEVRYALRSLVVTAFA